MNPAAPVINTLAMSKRDQVSVECAEVEQREDARSACLGTSGYG